MIKACFTLLENKLSKAGDKNIYIKVVDPNQKTLVSKDPINIISSSEKKFRTLVQNE